jgi:hypothetical protein
LTPSKFKDYDANEILKRPKSWKDLEEIVIEAPVDGSPKTKISSGTSDASESCESGIKNSKTTNVVGTFKSEKKLKQ